MRKTIACLAVLLLLALLGPMALAAEAFSFVQLCDPQLGFGAYQRDVKVLEQAVTQINALKPDLVVVCGDLIHLPENLQAFEDYKRAVGKLTMPCYPAPGNHDVGAATPALLERYRSIIGKDYYSFEHKGYTFAIANSQLWAVPPSDAMREHDAWLKDTIEAAAAKSSPIIVVMHHPLYAETPDEPKGYFNIEPERRKELLDLFKANGVVAVLTGHAHKTIVNEYEGIQLVSSATTSVNFDKHVPAFRLWRVAADGTLEDEVVPVDVTALATPLRVAGKVTGLRPGEQSQVMLVQGRARVDAWGANTMLELDTRVVGKTDASDGTFTIDDVDAGRYTLVALGIAPAKPGAPMSVRVATKPLRVKRKPVEEIELSIK